jgi:hypothetical protein
LQSQRDVPETGVGWEATPQEWNASEPDSTFGQTATTTLPQSPTSPDQSEDEDSSQEELGALPPAQPQYGSLGQNNLYSARGGRQQTSGNRYFSAATSPSQGLSFTPLQQSEDDNDREWSTWEWSDQYQCEWRTQKNSDGMFNP